MKSWVIRAADNLGGAVRFWRAEFFFARGRVWAVRGRKPGSLHSADSDRDATKKIEESLLSSGKALIRFCKFRHGMFIMPIRGRRLIHVTEILSIVA